MSESDRMTSLHSEVGSVSTYFLWSFHQNLPRIILTRFHDLSNLDSLSSHHVAARLYKHQVIGPIDLAWVSVGPLFGEHLARLHLILVTDTLFHESPLEARLALAFFFWGLFHIFHIFHNRLVKLANHFNRCLWRLPDLEHGVLHVYSFSFTLLANVVIGANWALVAYTD